ncbi:MAG: gliding motility-associated C-terminal domain-containing protein [Flavobacteriales bacterium]|nr:gliding motility-associated C-terminal domain-containing protein [Flavobacteriales bacterium]
MRSLASIVCLLGSTWAFASGPLVPFTQNKGQWPAQVLYRANIPGGVLFVERNALTYVLKAGGDLHHHGLPGEHLADPLRMHAYRVTFEGATGGTGEGRFAQPHYENHFIGNDPAKWGSQCAVYGEVWVKDLYPGVDLRLDGRNGLKYDLIVSPGADPDVIRMRYEGQDGLALKDGALKVTTSTGVIVEEAPVSFVERSGITKEVSSAYVLNGNTVGFHFCGRPAVRSGAFCLQSGDRITIDPTLTFGSYTGSTADNFGFTATYDDDGHLYGGGIVFGIGYPVTLGVLDASFNGGTIDIGISKWQPDGSSLVWSTYLGGSLGNESPHSLVVNTNDELYVLGSSGSSDFPTTAGCFDNSFNGGPALAFGIGYGYGHNNGVDIVVAHLNAAATALIGSTYVGGSGTDGINNALTLAHNYGDSFRGEIALDPLERPVVATSTESSDCPTTPGAPQAGFGGVQDAYIFRLDPGLTTQLWATYHGGSNADSGYGVQFDSAGEVYVAGGTTSSDLPMAGTPFDNTANGDVDGYAVRFNANGTTRLSATYLGTNQYDQTYFIQLNLADEVFVVGQTHGTYPVTPGKYANPGSSQFIHKLSHDLSASLWSTRIGSGTGTEDISPSAFLVSDCGQIYFCGWGGTTNTIAQAVNSTTSGLPTTPGAFQTVTNGSDFYLMVLEPEAVAINYATFFGGSTTSEHVDGGTSRFDKNGNVYAAVCAGCGSNDDFPTTPGAWSQTNNSFNCNLGVFKFALTQPNALIDINGPSYLCLPNATAVFDNLSQGGTDFFWAFGDGVGSSTNFEPSYTYADTGSYTVMMVLTDSNDCVTNDTAYLVLTVLDPQDALIDPIDTLCPGASVQLQAHGGHAYSWFPTTGLSNANIANPVATPAAPTTYSVVVTDSCGTDTASIDIFFGTPFGEAGPDTVVCLGDQVPITALGGGTYTWSQGGTLSDPNLQSPLASPAVTTQYVVTITTPAGCVVTDSLVVTVEVTPPVPVSNDTSVCEAGSVQLLVSGGTTYTWLPAPGLIDLDGPDPVVSPLTSTTYYVNVGNSCGLTLDSVFVDVQMVVTDAWPDTIICPGESVSLYANGATQYTWSPPNGLGSTSGSPVTASPTANTTYRVIASSTAGCTDTAFVMVEVFPEPTVNAGADQQIDYGDQAQLQATGNGLIAWLTNPTLSCLTCTNPIASPEFSSTYIVTLTDTNGCVAKDDVFVIVDGTLYVPNTFTPNGDGINDAFYALATEVKTFKLYVFNRWGEKIYESDRLDRFWDGTYKGTESPIDTYVWRIDMTELSGEASVHYGHVNLVR